VRRRSRALMRAVFSASIRTRAGLRSPPRNPWGLGIGSTGHGMLNMHVAHNSAAYGASVCVHGCLQGLRPFRAPRPAPLHETAYLVSGQLPGMFNAFRWRPIAICIEGAHGVLIFYLHLYRYLGRGRLHHSPAWYGATTGWRGRVHSPALPGTREVSMPNRES